MLLLKNGKIFTMENDAIHYGDILVDEGKIVEIGNNIQMFDVETIDLERQILLPGLIDASTYLGLVESGNKFGGNDVSEKNTIITPHLRTIDGIYLWDECFDGALRNGVTTVVVTSGNENVIGSQGCAIKTFGSSLEDRIIDSCIYIQSTIGNSPKKWSQKKQETPLSRMGIIYLLRKSLLEAKDYIVKKKEGKIDFDNYDARYESLGKVVEGKVSLKINAHKVQDILSAIDIKNEFKINVIIDYCTEGYMTLKELKKSNIPVILGSLLTDTSSYELQNRLPASGKIISSEGICTSISTHHPAVPSELLLVSAAVAVKEGMPNKEALKAITINPARALGLDHRIGSIKVGKDADFVVFDGDPLKTMSRVAMTFINGKMVYKR